MPEKDNTENPVQTSGTVAGRGATITPRKDEDESSPGAAADKKLGENKK